MDVIGKNIGNSLDKIYENISAKASANGYQEIVIESFEGGTFSSVIWETEKVKIRLHTGVPTHAMPRIFGVALQHVRQRLDKYPTVQKTDSDVIGGSLVRDALRELVLAPEANGHLAHLDLDTEWEDEQRHQGLKQLIKDAPEEFRHIGEPGNAFASLLYARYCFDHPEAMWKQLKKQFADELPAAAENGESIAEIVSKNGWATPNDALNSLRLTREELNLAAYVAIEDRLKSELV
ncbi:MAG: hypothetical protein P8J64_03965 [Dehalococcoidia bacterium]|nr:hypothetical protein [Dehalococcoidia bacterium]